MLIPRFFFELLPAYQVAPTTTCFFLVGYIPSSPPYLNFLLLSFRDIPPCTKRKHDAQRYSLSCLLPVALVCADVMKISESPHVTKSVALFNRTKEAIKMLLRLRNWPCRVTDMATIMHWQAKWKDKNITQFRPVSKCSYNTGVLTFQDSAH